MGPVAALRRRPLPRATRAHAKTLRTARIELISCLVESECEEDVARATDETDVAGRDVDHAIGDDRSGLVDRAAICRDAVDRFELFVGVELPDDRSVGGGVGAH